MNESVLISEHAWRAEGSRTFVQVGTRVPVDVLVKGMIIQSGNDATIALAERVGGSEAAFVQMMNGYAQRLGMHGTHFEDTSGLPNANHYSTARDLAILSRAMIRDFPQYYGIFAMREFTWNNIRQENRNGLLERDPSVDGIKTGHTDTAGYCLISSAHRSGMRLISVVLGSPSVQARESASAALLNVWIHLLRDRRRQEGRRRGVEAARLQRLARNTSSAAPGQRRAGDRAARPGRQCLGARRGAPTLIAPLAANAAIGQMQVSWPAKLVATVPLYPAAGSGRRRPLATPGRHHHPLVLGRDRSLHGRATARLLPQWCAACRCARRGFHRWTAAFCLATAFTRSSPCTPATPRDCRPISRACGAAWRSCAFAIRTAMRSGQNSCSKLATANGGGDLYVYLQVSRGVEFGRNHAPLPEVEPTIFGFCSPLPAVSAEVLENGVACITAPDTRWARCDIKSVALLANVLLRQQAVEAGAAETILLRDGWLTDASASAVHVVVERRDTHAAAQPPVAARNHARPDRGACRPRAAAVPFGTGQ